MKEFFTLIAALCLTCTAAAQQNISSKTSKAESEIRNDSSRALIAEFQQLAEIWRQAYNSQDAANLAPLYSQDAEYISAHVDGYIAHGHTAVIKNFQKGMDGGGYLKSLKVLSVASSCDIATVVTRYRGTTAGHNVDGRNLLVWKKIDGTWLVLTHMTAVRD